MDATLSKETTAEGFCVDRFVEHINRVIDEYWTRNNYKMPKPRIVAAILSDKWIRLENQELRDNNGTMEYRTTSVYGFVARQGYFTKAMGEVVMGGIYKAASFKAPAKHHRGNIYDNTTFTCAGPHGLAYLAPGRKAAV